MSHIIVNFYIFLVKKHEKGRLPILLSPFFYIFAHDFEYLRVKHVYNYLCRRSGFAH